MVESGPLGRYVVDPAAGTKTSVNPGDDLYEDAHGKIWELH